MADTMALIRDRVDLPVIIDADTGFGNALNAQRTMRMYERAGANALQVEDQTFPKRCGHLSDKSADPRRRDGRQDRRPWPMPAPRDETLIVARTDAVAVEGFDAALDRGRRPMWRPGPTCCSSRRRVRGGAMRAVTAQRFAGPRPAPGEHGGGRRDTRSLGAATWRRWAFHRDLPRRHRAGTREAPRGTTTPACMAHGSNRPFADRMYDFEGLNAQLGTPEMLAERGKAYETIRTRTDHARPSAARNRVRPACARCS
jgi:hypothetical protein